MRVYVASSWRNERQPVIVARLRKAGHLVYDFRNPADGDHGFHWSDIDPEWKSWGARAFRKGLQHVVAVDGFGKDMAALRWAEVCVLVLPCGRSAHLEAGFAVGNGARTFVLLDEAPEPELMYRMMTVCLDIEEVVDALKAPKPEVAALAAAHQWLPSGSEMAEPLGCDGAAEDDRE